jgi:ADP-ribose pyrophosphatase
MKARPSKAPPIPAHPGLEVRADEVAWDGRFPLQRVVFTYERFDGTRSAELTWELWRRGRGVAVLPYDPATDRIALIRQFRLPALAAGLDAVMTECAAGLLELAEDPEAAARRELAEETGLRAGRMERIGRYMLMQGGCDEVMFY